MPRLLSAIRGYFCHGIFGAIAGLVSLGSGIAGLVGGGGSSGSPSSGYGSGVPYYTPPNQAGIGNLWNQILTQAGGATNNLPNAIDPLLRASLNNALGINYNPRVQAGQQAGSAYGNLAGTSGMTGQALQSLASGSQQLGAGAYGTGNELLAQLLGAGMGTNQALTGAVPGLTQPLGGVASQILGTSMDPQQALYGRTLQQITDQSNAMNSMYGLGKAPAGAGVTGQNVSNFNIDWQNQQLARQIQGAQAAGGAQSNIAQILSTLYGGGASALGGLAGVGAGSYGNLAGLGLQGYGLAGNQLGQSLSALSGIPGYLLSAGQVPLQTQQTAAAAPGQAATTYAGQIG